MIFNELYFEILLAQRSPLVGQVLITKPRTMKQFNLISTAVIAIMLFCGFISIDHSSHSILKKELKGDVTKAIFYNGKVMPHVILPEVTISAKRPVKHLESAIIYNGKVIPSIALPEVVIRWENTNQTN